MYTYRCIYYYIYVYTRFGQNLPPSAPRGGRFLACTWPRHPKGGRCLACTWSFFPPGVAEPEL